VFYDLIGPEEEEEKSGEAERERKNTGRRKEFGADLIH
jgi:hypothetical protein